MNFDPMRGPAALSIGREGALLIGGLRAGTLKEWRVVQSPTTGKLTLFGQGAFLRYYMQHAGGSAVVSLIPSTPPYRIGRPKPKPLTPFRLRGKLLELTANRLTLSEAELARD